MRVCMISPHHPPEQAANALLPIQIGHELQRHGVSARYITHRPAGDPQATAAEHVSFVPRRGRTAWSRSLAGAVATASRIAWRMRPIIRQSDLVHLHGNGLIVEVGGVLAMRARKPYVITLYGTDVWHFDPSRHARFGEIERKAACRIFYSQGLLEFGRNLTLAPEPSIVIYAPVSSAFRSVGPDERRSLRRELGIDGESHEEPLVLTVKRLHAVGGQDLLIRAMPAIAAQLPGATLWLAGEGETRPELDAIVSGLGLGARVRFLGRIANDDLWRYYAAADLFVLPSRLESWGTVMLEALACGTPIVASATAGAREVQQHFPEDVELVAPEAIEPLAAAVVRQLRSIRRTSPLTLDTVRTRFSISRCALEYLQTYQQALALSPRFSS